MREREIYVEESINVDSLLAKLSDGDLSLIKEEPNKVREESLQRVSGVRGI